MVEVLDPLLYEIHKTVKKAAQEKNGFVCTVGGDHSVATGSISGMKSVHENLKVEKKYNIIKKRFYIIKYIFYIII